MTYVSNNYKTYANNIHNVLLKDNYNNDQNKITFFGKVKWAQ